VEDRYDRRELLLHLGDVLEAMSCVSRLERPDASVVELARVESSLRDFPFLATLAPETTASRFVSMAASGFFLWPKELLSLELNRGVLAATVQNDLFSGNPSGWAAYVALIQQKVSWFGVELAPKADVLAAGVEPDVGTGTKVPVAKAKTGWPWTPTKASG
jgi:hypothetical protein